MVAEDVVGCCWVVQQLAGHPHHSMDSSKSWLQPPRLSMKHEATWEGFGRAAMCCQANVCRGWRDLGSGPCCSCYSNQIQAEVFGSDNCWQPWGAVHLVEHSVVICDDAELDASMAV